MKYYFLIRIVGGIEPEQYGPFSAAKKRDNYARNLRRISKEDDTIISLDSTGMQIEVGTYSNAFMEGE